MAIRVERTITIREADPDIDTGLDINHNELVLFEATGTIWSGVVLTGRVDPNGVDRVSNNPKFPLHTGSNAHPYCLLGKLDNAYFFVGASNARVYQGSGSRLLMRINDDAPGNGNGAFSCTIRVSAPVLSSFSGSMSIHTTISDVPDLTLQIPNGLVVAFDAEQHTSTLVSFPTLSIPVSATNTLTVSASPDGTGTFTIAAPPIHLPHPLPGSGSEQITLPVFLQLHESSGPVPNIERHIILTTGEARSGSLSVTGSPLDDQGHVRLVAATDLPLGNDATVVFDGTFAPHP